MCLKTCKTDTQNGAVRMRSTEFRGKTFFELKIKCVEHLRGYTLISRGLALQARGSEIKTLCFQNFFLLWQDSNLESFDP